MVGGSIFPKRMIKMMQFFTQSLQKGIHLHFLQTAQFKTTAITFYIERPMNRQEATMNALLPMVLRRGCPQFPASRDLARKLDGLYGASLDSGVRKRGDRQMLILTAAFANEKFLKQGEPILQPMLSLLGNMLFEQQSFSPEYVAQEKENLRSQILAQLNDKRAYAVQRCTEIMCADEPFGLSRLGYIEDLDAITPERLYAHYRDVCLKSAMDIFVCGDVDPQGVGDLIRHMVRDVEVAHTVFPNHFVTQVGEVKRVTEEEQIAQGKLTMGFRTGIAPNGESYPALMMYNSVLGSGAYSKLFNNVREKLSLAYYASSSLDFLKGILYISSGIEVSNFERAYDEICVQMQMVEQGEITQQELDAARLGIISSLNAISDSPMQMEDFFLTRRMAGVEISPTQLVAQINQVTKEQIMEVAKQIKLDTVYFLKGVEA